MTRVIKINDRYYPQRKTWFSGWVNYEGTESDAYGVYDRWEISFKTAQEAYKFLEDLNK